MDFAAGWSLSLSLVNRHFYLSRISHVYFSRMKTKIQDKRKMLWPVGPTLTGKSGSRIWKAKMDVPSDIDLFHSIFFILFYRPKGRWDGHW